MLILFFLIVLIIFNKLGKSGASYDGHYHGEFGFHTIQTGATSPKCPRNISFSASITDGVLVVDTEQLWAAALVSNSGEIDVDGSRVFPKRKGDFRIFGPLKDAKMQSDYCGAGFFKLEKSGDANKSTT